MSVKELEDRVRALPPRDLAQFCHWLDSFRGEVLGGTPEDDDWKDNLTKEQKNELLRRVELAKAHPEKLQPWDGTTDRIRKDLHALRTQKTSRSRG